MTESRWLVLARLAGLLAGLGALARFGLSPAPVERAAPPSIAPVVPGPGPATTPPPALDRAAVARAEADRDAARRDRDRAEASRAEAESRLRADADEAAAALSSARSVLKRVRDPSARIASAEARGGRLKDERDALKRELVALLGTPRPRARPLVDKSPVARAPDGDEFHFEVRGDRVAVIDLERLLDEVRSDARLRVRLAEGRRPIAATVGPVGAFSIHYEAGRSPLDTLADTLPGRGITYGLLSWEIVPERETRGETLAMTSHPASEFGRAVNRLDPAKDALTIWVYPDGFPLYRQLRDLLHARGFLVSARPLPAGMPIRGSPLGSVSAAQ